MIEREEQIPDGTERLSRPWTRPELHRLDAGDAEMRQLNPPADNTTTS